MSDARIPRIAYGLLLGTGVLDWVRRYPLLPARMASHFGPHGPSEVGKNAIESCGVIRRKPTV
jgi:hypothetical protein